MHKSLNQPQAMEVYQDLKSQTNEIATEWAIRQLYDPKSLESDFYFELQSEKLPDWEYF